MVKAILENTFKQKVKSKSKSQSSLEYILLIAGGIIVAVTVVTILLGVASATSAPSTTYSLLVQNYMAVDGVLYYRFDEGAGTRVYDSSYNDFDGLLKGYLSIDPSAGWVNGKFGHALSFYQPGGASWVEAAPSSIVPYSEKKSFYAVTYS